MITVIGNMKGGTGKSTVTFNLAVWYATQGDLVTLYDLDPQQTLYDVVEVRREEGYFPALAMPLGQKDLATIVSDMMKQRDKVLMDVSMSNQEALDQAIEVADSILIPVAPSQADIWSTQRFLKRIKQIRGDDLPQTLAFINRADTHPFVPETQEAERALDQLSVTRVPVRLYNRTAYRRSFSEGLGVFELEPSGKASHEFNKFMKQIESFVRDKNTTENS